ncbi:MAG: isoprenoid biosynthesis glyoxalase ElbB [Planctomycetes bacterium]|nr:isoprenoid biosynthesis glyoxalase ElbB [Planctomycetota bacterium]
MAPNVAVVLSGCGFLDGSEIHESVLTLFHLQRCGATTYCLAPRRAQTDVVDHSRGEAVVGAARDVFTEAARIARGKVADLATASASDFDAIVLPGGYGAAKNLSDFASAGAAATADADLARLLQQMHASGKPIGAICIAPAVLAAVLGRSVHPTLTIGNDTATAAALGAMGASHLDCAVTECVVDADNRIVTTPAYMYDARVDEVAAGIGKLVEAVLAMTAENAR